MKNRNITFERLYITSGVTAPTQVKPESYQNIEFVIRFNDYDVMLAWNDPQNKKMYMGKYEELDN